MALGADSPRVVRMILRDTLVPTLTGVALGLCAAAAASRSLASLLYDIKPNRDQGHPNGILASSHASFRRRIRRRAGPRPPRRPCRSHVGPQG